MAVGKNFPIFLKMTNADGKNEKTECIQRRFQGEGGARSDPRNNSLEELAKRYCLHPNLIKNWKSVFMKRAKYVLADRRQRTTRTNGFTGNP
jgi:hypothetical protein